MQPCFRALRARYCSLPDDSTLQHGGIEADCLYAQSGFLVAVSIQVEMKWSPPVLKLPGWHSILHRLSTSSIATFGQIGGVKCVMSPSPAMKRRRRPVFVFDLRWDLQTYRRVFVRDQGGCKQDWSLMDQPSMALQVTSDRWSAPTAWEV
jgi:hypothetical protein